MMNYRPHLTDYCKADRAGHNRPPKSAGWLPPIQQAARIAWSRFSRKGLIAIQFIGS